MTEDAIDQASEQYDRAEQAYITAIASGAEEAALRSLARHVAEAAQAWEDVENAADSPPRDVTRYYDAPEILSTLWRDLADAYDRRTRQVSLGSLANPHLARADVLRADWRRFDADRTGQDVTPTLGPSRLACPPRRLHLGITEARGLTQT